MARLNQRCVVEALVFLDLLMKTNPSKLHSPLFLAVIPVPVLENWERETWQKKNLWFQAQLADSVKLRSSEQWSRSWLFVLFYPIDMHKLPKQPVECYKGQVVQALDPKIFT